jgi:diguanylate cyclase (GGDEF)-like protein
MRATHLRAADQGRRELPAVLAWSYVGLAVLLALLLVALRTSAFAAIPLVVAGLGTTVLIMVGRARNHPSTKRPWTLYAASCFVFIVGAVLRQLLVDTPLAPLADVASVSGYGLVLAAFIAILRTRGVSLRGLHELVDGLIVVIAAAAVALLVFTLPTATYGDLSPLALLQGVYPVLDVCVLFVILLLSWTSADRVTSYWLLTGATLATLTGDLGYAYIGTQGHLVGSPLLDLPFVFGFALLGAAALHPSMAALTAAQERPIQAWSRPRLTLLVGALLLPPFVVLGWSESGAADWVGSISGLMVALLVLVRAVGAVRGYVNSQEGLRHQATRDTLTGLANRPYLVERVDALIRRGETAGGHVDLLFLDIDGFKLVNDSWGHHVGDRVLVAAAERLAGIADRTDVVARIGGDEFVLARFIGPDGGNDGQMLAADVIDAFRRPLTVSDTSLVTTVSVGMARSEFPATAEGLLRDSDTAMYRAKDAGRNRCIVFDSTMRDSVRARVETELALRHALDRDQLILHYQPIVSIEDGSTRGFEALLRWAHPGKGMISPLDFIPVAEETGLIIEIGEWVVSEAIRQLASWRAAGIRPDGHDMFMALNVSARQLQETALVEHVEAELLRHDVPAHLLVVELTESAMMADPQRSAVLLNRLRDLGVMLAVDDFGTGYSSLSHLRRFPVSEVKIDRSFVSGIEQDAADAEIVRAIVAMSFAMRMQVVAEGIETVGQRDLLERLGVRLGQGWLFGRPQPAEDCVFETALSRRA